MNQYPNHYPGHRAPAAPGFIPYSCRDVADGLGDWFLRKIGVPVPNAHPVSDHLMGDFGAGISTLARHWLAQDYSADSLRGAPRADVIGRAMGRDDFVSALTSGWNRIVASTFAAQISGYRSIVREIPVPNFQPQHVPDFGGVSDLQERPEHAQWEHGRLYASSVLEDVQVGVHGLQFSISREALINDAVFEIAALMQSLGNIAALHVAASIASTLEATDTLSDGAQYFATSAGNLVEYASGGGAPSITTLDTAGVKLWRRPVGEHIAGVAPRYVVVPPELSNTARVLVASIWDPQGSAGTVPDGRCDVITLPHLVNTADWFLMGDPVTAPALALLRLAGGNGDFVRLERITVPNRDGITLRLQADYKIARVSRVGVVKIEGAA